MGKEKNVIDLALRGDLINRYQAEEKTVIKSSVKFIVFVRRKKVLLFYGISVGSTIFSNVDIVEMP